MGYVENNFEAADRVKKLWKKYGNFIMTVILVIMVIIVGLQYWHKHENKVSAEASIAYENLLGSVMAKKTAEVQGLATQLMNDFSGTPYAKFAAFLLAQQNVNAKEYPAAAKNLQWVVDHAKVASFKAIAQIRLARVLIAENNAQQAVTVLQGVKPDEYQALANTVKGDAYVKLNNLPAAKTAYQQALKTAVANTPMYAYIEMRLYSL